MNKLVILSLLILLVSGCTGQTIGGQRDEHGCLTPAGYSWDEEVGACLRNWELNTDQKAAAKTAVNYVGYQNATTILNVSSQDCTGCFKVYIEQGENRDSVAVEIADWTASGKTVTRHTCTIEEKQAEACTLEYMPVCGFKPDGTSMTYGNGCGACSDGADYWEAGECKS